MSGFRRGFFFSQIAPLVLGALLASGAMARQPSAPYGPQDVAAFLGTWCAQGDPSKQASIATGQGVFLMLTNEAGSTSYGHLQAPGQIIAPEWQFVVGRLSPDGSQINWSNGTMWARCPSDGGWPPGWPGYGPQLTGTWFAGGDRSRRCSISQQQGSLSLQNEAGQTANGSFVRRRDITTSWNGTVINGHVSRGGNRIDWSNGTYWVRDEVYTQ